MKISKTNNNRLEWDSANPISTDESQQLQQAVVEHYKQVMQHLAAKLPEDANPQFQVAAYRTPQHFGVRMHVRADGHGLLAAEVFLGWGYHDDGKWTIASDKGIECKAAHYELSVKDTDLVHFPYGDTQSFWTPGLGDWPNSIMLRQDQFVLQGSCTRAVLFEKPLVSSTGVQTCSAVKNPKLIANDLAVMMRPSADSNWDASFAQDAVILQKLIDIVRAAPSVLSVRFRKNRNTSELVDIAKIDKLNPEALHIPELCVIQESQTFKLLGGEMRTSKISVKEFVERVWTPVDTLDFVTKAQQRWEWKWEEELQPVLESPANLLLPLTMREEEEGEAAMCRMFPALSRESLRVLRRIFGCGAFIEEKDFTTYGHKYFVSSEEESLMQMYGHPQWMVAHYRALRMEYQKTTYLSYGETIPEEALAKMLPQGYTLYKTAPSPIAPESEVFFFVHKENMALELERQGFDTTDAAIAGTMERVVNYFAPSKQEVEENRS